MQGHDVVMASAPLPGVKHRYSVLTKLLIFFSIFWTLLCLRRHEKVCEAQCHSSLLQHYAKGDEISWREPNQTSYNRTTGLLSRMTDVGKVTTLHCGAEANWLRRQRNELIAHRGNFQALHMLACAHNRIESRPRNSSLRQLNYSNILPIRLILKVYGKESGLFGILKLF